MIRDTGKYLASTLLSFQHGVLIEYALRVQSFARHRFAATRSGALQLSVKTCSIQCLSLALICVLNGCLHTSVAPEERRTGIDLVGLKESSASIRVGVSTRSEIVSALGEPAAISPDGRAMAYAYRPTVARSGFVFFGGPCGLCGYYPFEHHTRETLWLAFDRDDRLKSFASSRQNDGADWAAFCTRASQTDLPK